MTTASCFMDNVIPGTSKQMGCLPVASGKDGEDGSCAETESTFRRALGPWCTQMQRAANVAPFFSFDSVSIHVAYLV